MGRMRVVVLILGLVAGDLVVDARPALACSCAGISLDQEIHDAPYVFIGTPVSMTPVERPNVDTSVTFEVTEVLYGDVGTKVEVEAARNPSHDCGDTPWAAQSWLGRETAVLAWESSDGRMVNTGGCSHEPTVAELRAALSGSLPAPTSTEPMAALVPYRWRWGAVAAVDAAGGLVAWGTSHGGPQRIATCPDSAHSVETPRRGEIQVRDLATMAVVATHSSEILAWEQLVCLGYNGGAVDTLSIEGSRTADETISLLRSSRGVTRARLDTLGSAAVLDRARHRVLVLPRQPGRITAVGIDDLQEADLDAPRRGAALAGALHETRGLAVLTTPAVLASHDSAPGSIDVYAVDEDGLTLASSFVPDLPGGQIEHISWSDDGIVVAVRRARRTRLVRFTPEGEELGRVWVGRADTPGLVVGDRYLSRSIGGDLSATPLGGGEAIAVATTAYFEGGPPVPVLDPPERTVAVPAAPRLLPAQPADAGEPPTAPAPESTTPAVDGQAAPATEAAPATSRTTVLVAAALVATIAAGITVVGIRRRRVRH